MHWPDRDDQRCAQTCIIAEPVPARAYHQRVALVPDRRHEIAPRTDRGRHQERLRPKSEIARERRGNWRHHQHRRGVVEERRHRHRRRQDQRDRTPGRQGRRVRRQPGRDHFRRASRAQRIADGDQRAEHDQDWPFDMVVRLAHRQHAGRHDQPCRSEERNGHQHEAHRGRAHRHGQDADRQPAPLRHAEPHLALCQRQAAEIAQLARQLLQRPLQHQHFARAQLGIGKAAGKMLALPRDRDQVHAVARLQREPRRGLADQCRAEPDHRLDHADLVVVILVGLLAVLALQLQPVARDHAFEGVRIAAEDQRVARAEMRVLVRRAPHPRAEDTGDRHLAVVAIEERVDRLVDRGRDVGNRHLGDIALDVERLAHRRCRAAIARQQPVREPQVDQPHQRQPELDRRIVEHPERMPGHLLADATDDDVGRGADQRDQSAEQRCGRHRHEKDRGRRIVLLRHLECCGHQHRQRADVLDQCRREPDRPGQQQQLRPDARPAWRTWQAQAR